MNKITASNTKPLLLVVNPNSGKGMAKQKLYNIVSLLSCKGFDVTVYPTKRTGTALYVAQNVEKYDRIICCGGDGTLSEVLAGVAFRGSKVPVGLIPLGSTNDFAKNMHIPKNVVLSSLIATGQKYTDIDIGTFNGKAFSYIAAVGAFTEVSYSAPQKLKNTFGHFAYILEGAKSLTNIRPQKITLNYNGKTVTDSFIYASVSNTYSVGGIISLDKQHVRLNDGSFELLLVRQPKTHAQAVDLLIDVASSKMKSPLISIEAVESVQMNFETPTVFSLDGERSEAFSEITIKNHCRKVRLIVPSPKKSDQTR